ncbi:hypothetical protein R1flu_023045 [Riccia fluitans]|uniref:Uncharacterized protein n=1 Tax=Riccia fluitans TaxID=41844 RepID=A0ABD1XUZ6_9MARC
MINCFIGYLETGSIESQTRSQILWLQEEEPFIEVNLGFVETYRDPQGSRAEFEGYVAVVNQTVSKQFRPLRERAEYCLSLLPWPKEFHAEKIQCPTFSCFEVQFLAFSRVRPQNFEDVRMVPALFSFGLRSSDHSFQTTFLYENDAQAFQKMGREESVVQIAFHELLGHGSGKLFRRNRDGGFNFRTARLVIRSQVNQFYLRASRGHGSHRLYRPGGGGPNVHQLVNDDLRCCNCAISSFRSSERDSWPLKHIPKILVLGTSTRAGFDKELGLRLIEKYSHQGQQGDVQSELRNRADV